MVDLDKVKQAVREDIENVIHHTEKVAEAAVARANEDFNAEKKLIAQDLRTQLAAAKAELAAKTPAVEAAVVSAVDDLIKVAEAALAAHGL
jgi:hypothetical protein